MNRAVVAGSIVAAALAAGATPAEGDRLVSVDGNDTLLTPDGNDVLVALDGNDTLIASDGNDVLIAPDGNDTLVSPPEAWPGSNPVIRRRCSPAGRPGARTGG